MDYRHYVITSGDDVVAVSEAQGFEAALADHYQYGLGIEGMKFEETDGTDNRFDRVFTYRIFEVRQEQQQEMYSELSISMDAGETVRVADIDQRWFSACRFMRVC